VNLRKNAIRPGWAVKKRLNMIKYAPVAPSRQGGQMKNRVSGSKKKDPDTCIWREKKGSLWGKPKTTLTYMAPTSGKAISKAFQKKGERKHPANGRKSVTDKGGNQD